MKKLLILASLVVLAGCASKPKTNADFDATSRPGASAPTKQIVAGGQEDLEQNVGHRVFFAYDRYTLTPQAQATLQKQAEWLKKYPNVRLQIAGNADERGTREYNMALGARRAEAARQYLVANGVAASRLTTISFGKERPIATGTDESAWSKNRNAMSMITGLSS